jgi:hypothetical protein
MHLIYLDTTGDYATSSARRQFPYQINVGFPVRREQLDAMIGFCTSIWGPHHPKISPYMDVPKDIKWAHMGTLFMFRNDAQALAVMLRFKGIG